MIATPGPRSHDVGRRCVRFYTIAVSFSFLDLAFVWEVGQVALGNPQTAMTSKDSMAQSVTGGEIRVYGGNKGAREFSCGQRDLCRLSEAQPQAGNSME